MPSSRANMIWISSSLRGRLPMWVVRKRWWVAIAILALVGNTSPRGSRRRTPRGRAKRLSCAPQAMADMKFPLLPTTVVGSYPQPDWLIDREALLAHTPPRVRMREVWRGRGRLLQAGAGHRG